VFQDGRSGGSSQRIREQVKEVFLESDGIYGSYKISDQMKNKDVVEYTCRNTVGKAMQDWAEEQGL